MKPLVQDSPALKAFNALLSYGARSNSSGRLQKDDGTLFRFDDRAAFFLSDEDRDSIRSALSAVQALENRSSGLADATPNQTDLSSLRKGAEEIEVTDEMIEAGKEAANGWTDRYMDGAEFVNWDEALPEIFRRMLALVSGSREGQADG